MEQNDEEMQGARVPFLRAMERVQAVRNSPAGSGRDLDLSHLHLNDQQFAELLPHIMQLQEDGFRIRNLTISHNNIQSIPSEAFHGIDISGNFELSHNPFLISLDFLAFQGMNVGGDFVISSNSLLASALLFAFSNVQVRGDFRLENNPLFSNLLPNAFNNMRVGGNFSVSNNSNLSSTTQFAFFNLAVGNDFLLSNNRTLSSIGQNSFMGTNVAQNIVVSNNPELNSAHQNSFTGSMVGGDLLFVNNNSAFTLAPDSLAGASVDGRTSVLRNDVSAQIPISAFGQSASVPFLAPASVPFLAPASVPVLAPASVLSMLTSGQGSNPNRGERSMRQGGGWPQRVRGGQNESVASSQPAQVGDNPSFQLALDRIQAIRDNRSNEPMDLDLSHLHLDFIQLRQLRPHIVQLQEDGFRIRNLTISHTNMAAVPTDFFRGLHLLGNLELSHNPSLRSLETFSFRRLRVDGDLIVSNNNLLFDFHAFSFQDANVGGNVAIENNPQLTNIRSVAFRDLRVDGDFSIRNNPRLDPIVWSSFSDLTVGGDFALSNNDSLNSLNRSSFVRVNVGGNLTVSNNPRLNVVHSGAFEQANIGGNLSFANNDPWIHFERSSLFGSTIGGQTDARLGPNSTAVPPAAFHRPALPVAQLPAQLAFNLDALLASAPARVARRPIPSSQPPRVDYVLRLLTPEARDNANLLIKEAQTIPNQNVTTGDSTRRLTLAHLLEAFSKTRYYAIERYKEEVVLPVLEDILSGTLDQIRDKVLVAMQSLGNCQTPVGQYIMQHYIGLMAREGRPIPADIAEKCALREYIMKNPRRFGITSDDVAENVETLLHQLFSDDPLRPTRISNKKNCSPASSTTTSLMGLRDPRLYSLAKLACKVDGKGEPIVVDGCYVRDDARVEGITKVFLRESGVVDKSVENTVSAFTSSCAKSEKISNLFTDYLELVENPESLCNADAFRSDLEAELLQRPNEDREAVCNEFLNSKVAQLEYMHDAFAWVDNNQTMATESEHDMDQSEGSSAVEQMEVQMENQTESQMESRMETHEDHEAHESHEGHWQNLHFDATPSTSGLAAALPAQEMPSRSVDQSTQDNAGSRPRSAGWSSVRYARELGPRARPSRRGSAEDSNGTQTRGDRSRSRSNVSRDRHSPSR